MSHQNRSIPKESVPDEGITKLNLNDASSSGQPDSTTGTAPQKKLSKEEQAKFQITTFKRATNEIEHWARVEEICDFFFSHFRLSFTGEIKHSLIEIIIKIIIISTNTEY